MNKFYSIVLASLLLLTICRNPLFSEITFLSDVKGRADIGPAYVHIDVLENGRTTHKMDLGAVKADSTIVLYKGFCIKPSILYGFGHGYVFSPSLGAGFVFPVCKNLYITPLVGYGYTYLRTKLDLKTPFFTLHHVREKFRSRSPYVGVDISYDFCDCWRICGSYQYLWSRTHTTIGHLISDNSHTQGSSFALMIERDLDKNWSCNIGGAYNSSLSKEKHGLRGYGFKLGIARWF